jgi:phage tail-like protein
MTDYPPAGFYFTVQLDAVGGPGDASFQEVSGIVSELDPEDHPEGGENRFVHSLPKGVKHPRLVLKRGIAEHQSPLVRWCRAVLEGGFSQPAETRDLTLCLLDEAGAPLRAWSFRNALPLTWEVDLFQAEKNLVAIEKIELTYSTSRRTSDPMPVEVR